MKLSPLATAVSFVTLWLASANGPQEQVAPEEAADSFSATVRVTDEVLNTVKPLIFGDNIEWVHDGMGFWLPQEQKLDEKLVAELRAAGVTHLRYPGGTLSDHFFWDQAIGTERQPIPNPFEDYEPQYPQFGPDELAALCRELGIPATITLNAGTGTPEQAAAWVKYCRDTGLDVTAFAVGNEVYMAEPQDPSAKTPQEYIGFYLRCWDEVQKAAPGTKLGAIGLHDTGLVPLSRHPDWLQAILQAIGDKTDFIDLHNSYAPVIRTVGLDLTGEVPSDDEFALAMVGASVYVQDNFAATKADLAQYAPEGGKDIEIHVTEYGSLVYPVRKGQEFEDAAWNRSLAAALYQACLFNVFLKEPKLTSANHLPLCQDVFGALIGIRHPGRTTWRNTVFYVFQMYAQMAGREVLATEVQSPTYSTTPAGIVPALEGVPYLDVGAYRTKDGRKLSVFLTNRDIKRRASVRIEPGVAAFEVQSLTILTADSYLAENSPERPDHVVPVRTRDYTAAERGLTTVLPKHSLAVIELSVGEE